MAGTVCACTVAGRSTSRDKRDEKIVPIKTFRQSLFAAFGTLILPPSSMLDALAVLETAAHQHDSGLALLCIFYGNATKPQITLRQLAFYRGRRAKLEGIGRQIGHVGQRGIPLVGHRLLVACGLKRRSAACGGRSVTTIIYRRCWPAWLLPRRGGLA